LIQWTSLHPAFLPIWNYLHLELSQPNSPWYRSISIPWTSCYFTVNMYLGKYFLRVYRRSFMLERVLPWARFRKQIKEKQRDSECWRSYIFGGTEEVTNFKSQSFKRIVVSKTNAYAKKPLNSCLHLLQRG
jgi:hypothetical protein